MGGSSGPQPAPVLVRARVLASGRVQGVFYRHTCVREARSRGLTGWVRNLPDGRVEAAFQGPRAPVEEMVGWSRHGPPSARVEALDVTWEEPDLAAAGFETRW